MSKNPKGPNYSVGYLRICVRIVLREITFQAAPLYPKLAMRASTAAI